MNRMNVVSLLAVALLASQVFGAVPNLINYQGVLTDDTGVVVADGSYKLTVRLYDVSTGGSAIFTESHDAVAVVDGVFSLSIGSVNTALGALSFDDPYYLSLEVNDSGVELTPRVALQAVPYALNAANVSGGGGGGDTDWVESGGNVYRLTGNVGIGTATPGRSLEVQGNGRFLDADGFPSIRLEDDVSGGGGGYFAIMRDSLSAIGFEVDGNFVSTREPRVRVLGSARIAILDMSAEGDDSVVLPGASINADETAQEPGLTHEGNGSTITLSGTTMIDVETITIEAPGPGFIMLEGRTNARFLGTTGQNQLYMQIDDDMGGGIEGFYWAKVGLTQYAGTGLAYFPVYCSRTFGVPAPGFYTFRLEAAEVSGNGVGATCSMYQTQLSAVYYPSAYGAVTAAVSDASGFQAAEAVRPDLDPADAAAGEYFRVDLRELERRAREARQRADEAERELQQARADIGNGE